MSLRILRHSRRLVLALGVISCVVASDVVAREVLIRIQGSGAGAKYIEDGATQQAPVAVNVGDTVVWKNEGNRTHTATAEADNGGLLFDTGDIPSGPDSRSNPVPMTATLFTEAGGQPGSPVTIEYFCDHHSSMQSSLVLSEMGRGDGGPIAPPRGTLRRRRDITTLTPAELNSYRDAWRLIQNNGQFRDIASYHGCSLFFCHRPGERIIFLPWHREYVLRLENALGEAVHYWDWTSAASASSGIPPAFTAATYVSADGNTYPNPLRSFRFSCPAGAPGQTTSRFPQSPLFLQQYASQVQTAYGSGSYAAINALLENPPHDNVHGWVGGTMGAVTFAAYDPIFWAHHTNVDRQWASWQQGGGADPIASVLSRSLTGFTGRTVNDVKSIAALNYEYDRYDTMPAGPFVVAGVAGADGATKAAGVGKTFNIEVPLGIAADRAVDQPLDLLVSGVAEHPTESYFVYVFVNKPDATPAEATPANPNFAGTFAIFGGAPGEAAQAAEHDQTTTKKVLQLFEGQDKRFGQPIRQVTLVVTDPTGAIVSREDIPFDGVTLRSAGETGVVMEGVAAQTGHADATAASQIFTGVSNTESYDEAYRDAVNKAQTALNTGGADRLIKVRVLSVDGERGGIAGLQRLRVTITARIE